VVWQHGRAERGLRLTAEQVADGIKARESGDQIAYGVADPSIFAQDGGPSIAERMFARGVTWRPADNTRIARHGAMGGWDLFRQRLRGEDGKPMAYWMSCCRDAIRTIPAMQHDDARPEDLASELEDHAVDADRYAFASEAVDAGARGCQAAAAGAGRDPGRHADVQRAGGQDLTFRPQRVL
jgi:hypothetical protein